MTGSSSRLEVFRSRASCYDFVNDEALPGTGVDPGGLLVGAGPRSSTIWRPATARCLAKRDELQAKIDAWHREQRGHHFDLAAYKSFLREIGYLRARGRRLRRSRTANVDPEIATIAGPQLVVPVMNARYALNAANARWGSLYDALYGTDAIAEDGGAARGTGYNPERGKRVIAFARELARRGRAARRRRRIEDATGLCGRGRTRSWSSGVEAASGPASEPAQLRRLPGRAATAPSASCCVNHGLHLEIRRRPQPSDRQGRSGRESPTSCWRRR